jgi:hypothetical protein
MLSLEQAESQYHESTVRASDGSLASPTRHQSLDPISKMETSSKNERVLDSDQRQVRLIDMAREDVTSTRSSLSSFPTEEGSQQAQVVRHSQRLSKLIKKDYQRMSQRRSQLLNSDIDDFAESTPLEDMNHSALPPEDMEEPREAHFTSTDYMRFRTWLLAKPWSVQDEIMKSLGADVFSNRLPDHQQEVSNSHLTAANAWLRRVDTSPAARG